MATARLVVGVHFLIRFRAIAQKTSIPLKKLLYIYQSLRCDSVTGRRFFASVR